MRILLTGATGFLGQNVLKALLEETSHKILCLIQPGTKDKLPEIKDASRSEIIEADITDYKLSQKFWKKKFDAVIHLAGISRQKPRRITFQKTHVLGTWNIVNMIEMVDECKRCIFVSFLGADEQSENEFLRTKALAEKPVRECKGSKRYPKDTVIFRPDILIDKKGAWGNILGSPFFHRFFLLPDGGKTKVSPISIETLTKAILRSLEDKEVGGKTFQLRGDEEISYKEFISRCGQKRENQISPLSVPSFLLSPITSVFDWLCQFHTSIENTALPFLPLLGKCTALFCSFPTTKEQIELLREHRKCSNEENEKFYKSFEQKPQGLDEILD